MPPAEQELANYVLEAEHPDGKPAFKEETKSLVVAVSRASELLREGYRVVSRSEQVGSK